MKSWEVLRDAIDAVGVKVIAHDLRLSAALVYKWCQEPPRDSPDASGARNPLDRIELIYRKTRDQRIINWICNAADGFYCPNPHIDRADLDEELLGATQHMVNDFGELLGEVSRSIQNDGDITPDEAVRIRAAWEDLKAKCECFVVACERGEFHTDPVAEK